MKLEEIQELWNRDREIDYTELGTESIRIPLIHDKYLKIFTQEKIRLKSVEFEMLKLVRAKTEYYSGKMSKEDIEFHKIPIRNGEKLHEEMISSIEMQRTKVTSSEKYMAIGWDRNNEDYNHTPLNSEFYVMDSKKTYEFLIDKGVL